MFHSLENFLWFDSEKPSNTWVKVESEFKIPVCLLECCVFMIGFSFCSYTAATNFWVCVEHGVTFVNNLLVDKVFGIQSLKSDLRITITCKF